MMARIATTTAKVSRVLDLICCGRFVETTSSFLGALFVFERLLIDKVDTKEHWSGVQLPPKECKKKDVDLLREDIFEEIQTEKKGR